jgi:hypothetical protein
MRGCGVARLSRAREGARRRRTRPGPGRASASPVAIAALRLRSDGRHSDLRTGGGRGGDPGHRICLGRYRGSDTRLGGYRGGTGADPDPIRWQRGHDGSGVVQDKRAHPWRGLRRGGAPRPGRAAAAPGGPGRSRCGRPHDPRGRQATRSRDRPDWRRDPARGHAARTGRHRRQQLGHARRPRGPSWRLGYGHRGTAR